MALRVLLADESTTIRKVIQLALQDFAVEVKAVPSGLDVTEVARLFRPDIVFADVLLQKRNGYEVCAELKRDSDLRSIPVVLMWNSFMAFDEGLARSSAADDRLEKPFDVETLRSLIARHVPASRGNPVGAHLEFDPGPAAQMAKEIERSGALHVPVSPVSEPSSPPIPSKVAQTPPQPPPETAPPGPWTMDSFDDIDSFAKQIEAAIPDPPASQAQTGQLDSNSEALDLDIDDPDEQFESFQLDQTSGDSSTDRPSARLSTPVLAPEPAPRIAEKVAAQTPRPIKPEADIVPQLEEPEADELWTNHDINEFRLDLRGDDLEVAEPIVPVLDEPPSVAMSEPEAAIDDDDATQTLAVLEPEPTPPSVATLDAVTRDEVRKVVERLVREILPDIAERIVRRELDRILDEKPGARP